MRQNFLDEARSRPRVIDTRDDAVSVFRTFHDREPDKEIKLPFDWPESMQEIGEGKAELYTSNKWQKSRNNFEDYKHVAEGSRVVYAEPNFLRDWGGKASLPVCGPMMRLQAPMPLHFSVLGKLLGLQVRLYRMGSNGEPFLPSGDDGLYEIHVPRGMLGAAKHPETGEPFLLVYTKTGGVHMILTGEQLDIEKDGIVG
jgi:hypothetical protein